MTKRRLVLALVMLLVAALLLGGCSINKATEEYQVGLRLKGGTEIVQIYQAGRHTLWGLYDEIKNVSVSAITVQWSDPDLVTKDKQPVGLSLQVTFARDKDEIETMWREYNSETISDEALMNQVLGRIPRVAKAVTTQYTLNEMLGIEEDGSTSVIGRYEVQSKMEDLLEGELREIYCVMLDIGINNIAPDEGYLNQLKEKAKAQIGVEVAEAQKTLADTQILTEQANTTIQLEIAKRERLVAQERAKVYETNPGWLKLQIWEAAKGVFAGDNVWFIDPNADLTLLFSGENVVPYPTQP